MVTIVQLFCKPKFHCDAKPLALGRRVGLDPKRDHLALVSKKPRGPNTKPHGPNATPTQAGGI